MHQIRRMRNAWISRSQGAWIAFQTWHAGWRSSTSPHSLRSCHPASMRTHSRHKWRFWRELLLAYNRLRSMNTRTRLLSPVIVRFVARDNPKSVTVELSPLVYRCIVLNRSLRFCSHVIVTCSLLEIDESYCRSADWTKQSGEKSCFSISLQTFCGNIFGIIKLRLWVLLNILKIRIT